MSVKIVVACFLDLIKVKELENATFAEYLF